MANENEPQGHSKPEEREHIVFEEKLEELRQLVWDTVLDAYSDDVEELLGQQAFKREIIVKCDSAIHGGKYWRLIVNQTGRMHTGAAGETGTVTDLTENIVIERLTHTLSGGRHNGSIITYFIDPINQAMMEERVIPNELDELKEVHDSNTPDYLIKHLRKSTVLSEQDAQYVAWEHNELLKKVYPNEARARDDNNKPPSKFRRALGRFGLGQS